MPSSAFECLNVPCTSLQQPVVVNAIGAHHDEMEMLFVISPIIQACDAISGARPGARREIMPATAHKILK